MPTTRELAARRPRVVILGGGFAGAFAAQRLLRKGRGRVDVELVDRENYFVFQPLLPEVAGGAVNVLDAVTPLQQMLRGARVRVGAARRIDLDARRVQVLQGEMGDLVDVSYDHLVMAFGQEVDLGRFPGMTEHAFTVKEATDTFALRNQIIRCLQQAADTGVAADRRRLLTFVVVGAGFSGVEVMGEIEELVSRGIRFFPGLRREEVRLVQVEFQKRILQELEEGLARYAHRILARRGVELILGHGVKSASAFAIELDDGRVVPTRTIVATIGNGPSPLLADLDVEKQRGRIVVDPHLRVVGRQRVWAAGDAAMVPLARGGFAPPTAQAARQQARLLADNLLAALDGRPLRAFDYRSKGTLASLGGRKAVAQIYGVRISGTPAWLLWRLVYVGMLPALSTRLRVAADQILDFFLPRSIVQTQQPPVPPTRFVRHRKGDVVVLPGQLGDGVHLVLSGRYEVVGQDGAAGAGYGPGDHFGDEAIIEHRANRCIVRAAEDASCFVLGRDDYERIVEAFGRVQGGEGRRPGAIPTGKR